jgi:hypothetical protein
MHKLLAAILLAGLSTSTFASRWFLIAVEKEPLYKAVGAFRIDTTLVRTEGSTSFIWVRTDYLRPKNFKFPKNPRVGDVIETTAFLWRKERFAVDCSSQMVTVDQGSYVLANDDVQWDSNSSHTTPASPNTIYALVFRLACDGSTPRPQEDLEQIASGLESKLLPRPEQREKIREEQNRPELSRT